MTCLIGLWILSCLLFLSCAAESGFQKKNGWGEKETSLNKGLVPLYYDFSDVLVPGELKIDRQASFIYQTAGLSAGVMIFSGNVEINSLITFFTNNMVKDDWQEISSIRSARTLMLFKKENRWCVITISKNDLFSMNVEIWVAPTVGEKQAGLLK
ncbi:MAG: hypothetical protein R6X10_15710 [Desulfobacterales bacterium]